MKSHCEELHQLCAKLQRYEYPFDVSKIPKNGIYIVFEKGEKAHGTDRIVRVGTHTGQDNLRPRLLEHFYKENKNRSIFRKNIGRVLLFKQSFDNNYLPIWNVDFTTKKNKEKYKDDFDKQKEQEIEKQVSDYIRKHISFVVLQVDSKKQRLELESKIFTTLYLCEECKASKRWFGKLSPKDQISNSGLWQVQGFKTPLTDKDMKLLRKIAHGSRYS